jgi:hypothetical protein
MGSSGSVPGGAEATNRENVAMENSGAARIAAQIRGA